MIDGIKIFIPNSQLKGFKKDKLISKGLNSFRLKKHEFDHNPLKLKITEAKRGLYIEGSLMYAINGNTFEQVNPGKAYDFLKALGNDIGVDILKGYIQYFEHGIVIEAPVSFKAFTAHHVGFPDMKIAKNELHYKIYANNKKQVKIYNAGKRLTQMPSDCKESLIKKGLYEKGKSYIKFEIVYLKPEKCFNSPICRVEDLFCENIIEELRSNLLATYRSMYKTGVKLPAGEIGLETVMYAALKNLEVKVEGLDINSSLLETLHELSGLIGSAKKYRYKKRLHSLFNQIKIDLDKMDVYSLLEAKLDEQLKGITKQAS